MGETGESISFFQIFIFLVATISMAMNFAVITGDIPIKGCEGPMGETGGRGLTGENGEPGPQAKKAPSSSSEGGSISFFQIFIFLVATISMAMNFAVITGKIPIKGCE